MRGRACKPEIMPCIIDPPWNLDQNFNLEPLQRSLPFPQPFLAQIKDMVDNTLPLKLHADQVVWTYESLKIALKCRIL